MKIKRMFVRNFLIFLIIGETFITFLNNYLYTSNLASGLLFLSIISLNIFIVYTFYSDIFYESNKKGNSLLSESKRKAISIEGSSIGSIIFVTFSSFLIKHNFPSINTFIAIICSFFFILLIFFTLKFSLNKKYDREMEYSILMIFQRLIFIINFFMFVITKQK